jgi:SAM-dependent methyltransferase
MADVPAIDRADAAEDLAAHFICPSCHSPLERISSTLARCPVEAREFQRVDGVWGFLPPERRPVFERFTREYEAIRRAEGRGSPTDGYYRALPFEDRSGRFADDWRIRAISFRTLLREVIEPFEAERKSPLRILDLGAGNGWLSYRLTQRGHRLAALDLGINREDGLGAHARYGVRFLPIQAEFDRIPFEDGLFDLAIFNASFHYSVDYGPTLAEALRVVSPKGGMVVILDTPIYRDGRSGEAMVQERQAQFRARYGFPSDALPSENYLTYRRLHELGDRAGVRWRVVSADYGLRWAIRPWVARLRRRREPAAFRMIVGTRSAGPAVAPQEDQGPQGRDGPGSA